MQTGMLTIIALAISTSLCAVAAVSFISEMPDLQVGVRWHHEKYNGENDLCLIVSLFTLQCFYGDVFSALLQRYVCL